MLPLTPFHPVGLDQRLLDALIDEHESIALPRLSRLWSYYRNERDASGRLAQERGLPYRITGDAHHGAAPARLFDDRAPQSEIVIENDIAWRIEAGVDFVFGKPLAITSTARTPERRETINRVLDAAWEVSGGVALLQDMALLGAVHGHVDLLLRSDALFAAARPDGAGARTGGAPGAGDDVLALARLLRIELIEAPRSIPVLDPGDYRTIRAIVIRALRRENSVPRAGVLSRITGRAQRRAVTESLEIISPGHHLASIDGAITIDEPNALGELPLVHVQNTSQPFRYEGLSDVEPLIALQDELNTRLSDRAHRVTLQSFKMYLARGLDELAESGVRPGMVWTTDNPEAHITEFGGDAHSPSESDHIDDLRDALDKASAISPVALGVVRAKLGHLSSENALRITLNGVLAETERKRVSYGRAIAQMSRLVLVALDRAGALHTEEADRGVRLEWPEPLPLDERDRLESARIKAELGIPREQILAELGYHPADAGIT